MHRRLIGYLLLALGASLLGISWVQSYPAGFESATSYMAESIHPLFWASLFTSNLGLFLIASDSKKRWERFACAVLFFAFAYSLKYFFAFLEGPDSSTFRGLTENLAATRLLSIEEHGYYQWPALFILGTVVSDVTGLSIESASEVLFACITFVLVSGLFFYGQRCNDFRDFLSVVAFGIAVYTLILWQYSAWAFALALLAICLALMSRDAIPYRVATIVVFVALVLTHAFAAMFLVLTCFLLCINQRRTLPFAIVLLLVYVSNLIFRVVILVQELTVLPLTLFSEYLSGVEITLAETVPGLDTVAQVVSRGVTLSIWALFGLLVLVLLFSKKLRNIDVSVGVSGMVYAAAGLLLPILGWRAAEAIFIPAANVFRSFRAGGRRWKAMQTYFLVALILFPFGLVHFYYNDVNFMTVREQHAVETVFLAKYQEVTNPDFRVLSRVIIRSYFESKASTESWWIDEDMPREFLTQSSWFHFIFMSPELEKTLVKEAGLSETQVSELLMGTQYFSRIYSNGHVMILRNANATAPPEITY